MASDRRAFLKLLAGGALASAFPASIKRALAIPAYRRFGTIADVEHVVVFMQENRSFDHYFGTLRGVRGFGDPRAVRLPSGARVWDQPDGGATVPPFHPDAPDLGLAFLEDLPHAWADQQAAWNGGRFDRWVPAKGRATMAYLTRDDIPFHYALADAFTICDAYHCSFLGPTDPNRYHMWTGWTGNDGRGGGPVLDNAEAVYEWTTYPERLQKAGVTWKVYQDVGGGLDATHSWGWGDDAYVGNYGDNSLLYFRRYQNARIGTPLFESARTGTSVTRGGSLFDAFERDLAANELPEVSWIVAPEAYSEHPNWPANYGAWYISKFLDALTSYPEIWSKTVLFLMYDENDGFFDHVVPPTPARSRADGLSTVATTHEVFQGNAKFAAGPFGLGMRVPMIVVSPWSTGGFVNSEIFDHTSIIRFIERRFGVIEPNITAWRRAVVGDLTSAFDFASSDPTVASLPTTSAFVPPDDRRHADFVPTPPSTPSLPRQEPGVRPARPLPYKLQAVAEIDAAGALQIRFDNEGIAAAVFQVRSGEPSRGPWSYTIGPDEHLGDAWPLHEGERYDFSVYGPGGFLRVFQGTAGPDAADLRVRAVYDRDPGITLEIRNARPIESPLRITDGYSKASIERALGPGATMVWRSSLEASFGWYDVTLEVLSDATFSRQLAGHVETGRDSVSDPLLGAMA